MSAPLLPDHEWQIAYGPQDDPLNRFYIPALQRSMRYDRSTGFFSSSALAVAAAGVAGLIANGGTMRLLVGAQLSEEDVAAITQGASLDEIVADRLVAALEGEVEDLLRRRLEILAWMVANGTLEIKVVVQKDELGLPVAGGDYYHPKTGIFTDAEGNQMAFVGSINESMQAWMRNYERFSVYFSWEATRSYLNNTLIDFERVWKGEDIGWIALSIPDAARQSLIRYAPDSQPEPEDPLVRPPEPRPDIEAELRRERVIIQFLRDMPYFPDNYRFGAATAAITPWPHQKRVSQAIIRSYPRSYMLCDEVGLGKTIEAGLVLRQLLLSGFVKRCLLLAPKSLARQWQEELYEKFVLDIPLFDGQRFWNYAGEQLPGNGGNPWDAHDVFIASSQLAKRRDRQAQVLAARPWDLVLIDEAHHARRKDFLQPQYRPNRLLELLTHPDFRARSLLLVTATPMQVHPLEVWDLLNVLGVLSGKWGADESNFLRFYRQLTLSVEDVDWDFIFGLVHDYLEYGGEIDEEFASQAQSALGLVDWERIRNLAYAHRPSQEVSQLPPTAHPYVYEMARRHTPLSHFMFRSTRELLRDYARRGLLRERVPYRDPELIWIPMRDEEMRLYLRIEEYISEFYRKYEQKRKGLGFVMTVYRRRLTSSFYAVRRSLERRLEFLHKGIGLIETFDNDDLEQDELGLDIGEDLEGLQFVAQEYQDEIAYVEDFLVELRQLSTHDSKVEQLLQDLGRLFRKRDTVIIFTQYTDTMDYLRDRLREVYGSQVACFSGRGGEKWNGIAWVAVPKERIKQEFREGEEIKVLVCTEAASEGLNLQTCGVLINYDMPWNPMRVEQRIGRVDRIGQRYERVWIRNYFYKDTIEARVYQALARRINWFKDVVGTLQPILAQVGQTIQRLAMASPAEREELLGKAIAAIERELGQQDATALDIYQMKEAGQQASDTCVAISLNELEQFLVSSRHFGQRFHPHPEIEGAYILETPDGEWGVTFDTEVFDDYPNTLYLLSFGSEVLRSLFAEVREPDQGERGTLCRVSTNQPVRLVNYYGLRESHLLKLETFQDLISGLSISPPAAPWPDNARIQAEMEFKESVRRVEQRFVGIAESRYRGSHAVLVEQALQILLRAAAIETIQNQRLLDGVIDNDLPITFREQDIHHLRRHGYPFDYLLRISEGRVTVPTNAETYYQHWRGASPEQLSRAFSAIKQDGHKLLQRVSTLGANTQTETISDGPRVEIFVI